MYCRHEDTSHGVLKWGEWKRHIHVMHLKVDAEGKRFCPQLLHKFGHSTMGTSQMGS